MKAEEFRVIFVDYIPSLIEDGDIYVSMKHSTAIHRCPCGCGSKVVTPLSPEQWSLIYDGRSITLHPSVGNYDLPCSSHYFIVKNRVIWADHKPSTKNRKLKKKRKSKKKLFKWLKY